VRYCSAALSRFCIINFEASLVFGTFRLPHRFDLMARARKSSKTVIPEPSFEFFVRAIGAMILLVVIMAAYFSLRT
jgi:hypothetical protein